MLWCSSRYVLTHQRQFGRRSVGTLIAFHAQQYNDSLSIWANSPAWTHVPYRFLCFSYVSDNSKVYQLIIFAGPTQSQACIHCKHWTNQAACMHSFTILIFINCRWQKAPVLKWVLLQISSESLWIEMLTIMIFVTFLANKIRNTNMVTH